MPSIHVELGPVQETLLIPLLGRAEESQRTSKKLLHDPRAVEIVESLDYDFDKWRGTPSMRGATLRTRMIDDEISAFLALHPKGTVVEIGCGLNTRFDRLDNGTVRWFDLDLPDTIALRRKFFEDRDRNTMISSSILDPDWISAVHSAGGPWCFVSEAVLIYLEEDEVRRVFSTISEHFEGAWIVTDTTSRAMVDGQSRHDVMRHLPPQSWFRWACDDPRELEGWGVGVRLTRSRTFLDASPNLLRQLPVVLQLLARFVPRFILKGIRGYKLNRFVVSEGRGATPSGGRVSVEW